MYRELSNKDLLEPAKSTTCDKISKLITLLVSFGAIGISVLLSLFYYGTSFTSAAPQQNGLIGYLSANVQAAPIRNITFREDKCAKNEVPTILHNWKGESSFLFWSGRLICVQRYTQYVRSSNCSADYIDCGQICIAKKESTKCPVTKISKFNVKIDIISSTEYVIELLRNNEAQPLYDIEMIFKPQPCINQNLNEWGAKCDQYGFDANNSVVIDESKAQSLFEENSMSTTWTEAKKDGMNASTQAYLVARSVVRYDYKCEPISSLPYLDTENSIKDVQSIAYIIHKYERLVYFLIRLIFMILLGVSFLIELVALRGRIINDLKTVSSIYKLFTLSLLVVLLIEGISMLSYQLTNSSMESYYSSKSSCFQQANIQQFIQDIQSPYSSELQRYIDLSVLCLFGASAAAGILLIIYIVQLCLWCRRDKGEKEEAQSPKKRHIQYQDDLFKNEKSEFGNVSDGGQEIELEMKKTQRSNKY